MHVLDLRCEGELTVHFRMLDGVFFVESWNIFDYHRGVRLGFDELLLWLTNNLISRKTRSYFPGDFSGNALHFAYIAISANIEKQNSATSFLLGICV